MITERMNTLCVTTNLCKTSLNNKSHQLETFLYLSRKTCFFPGFLKSCNNKIINWLAVFLAVRQLPSRCTALLVFLLVCFIVVVSRKVLFGSNNNMFSSFPLSLSRKNVGDSRKKPSQEEKASYTSTNFEVKMSRVNPSTNKYQFFFLNVDKRKEDNDNIMTYRDVIELWKDAPNSEEFRNLFTTALSSSSFPAFFWESPPLSSSSLSQPYECVLVNASRLDGIHPEPQTFSEHFEKGSKEEKIKIFSNLGGDAILLSPIPTTSPLLDFAHLANFLRKASPSQSNELWYKLGVVLSSKTGIVPGRREVSLPDPAWVSTSGLGVYWLHLRVDSIPKYYQHAPYKQRPPSAR